VELSVADCELEVLALGWRSDEFTLEHEGCTNDALGDILES
jgi:hypothetical protein